MAVALETFVKQLEDSGVIAPGKLENFIPPKATPKDAEELAQQLVQSGHLTKYQTQEIFHGRGKSLILGNYTILAKIGAGGMGQVFKAEHRRMHRVVAIKMLPAALTSDAASIARFEREVTAAAKLEHPNIVAAYDADEADGVHFLVMQYVEGADLAVLVKKNGPFSVAKAVDYILQAARGLDYAHKHGVIHRDIKPSNLLLSTEGTVKVLDMGLARIATPEGNAATQAELTGSGAVFGTVDYMSPEQALNTKNADHRADIYSLGISLYYLLTGKAAYEGESLMEKLLAHREQPIPALSAVRADVTDQVQAIFNKMVAKTVKDRYQSMADVVADLEKCQTALASASANTATSTWRSSPGGLPEQALARATPPVTSKKRTFAVVGVLACAALGGVILTRALTPKAQINDAQEVAEKLLPSAASPKSVAAGKPISTLDDPAFQQWMRDVAAMPAEEQIKAVSKKLQELNPGFDGTLTGDDGKESPTITNGDVVKLRISTDKVSNISPVRALRKLTSLKCFGNYGKKNGQVSDLSPLQGLRLTHLVCGESQVSDLSPLTGMPLTFLSCGNCNVSDLSPLAGMKLTSLYCDNTRVSDLSPLHEMPLEYLQCSGIKVATLSALGKMKLTQLHCGNLPQLSDLSPLHGMPLTNLTCNFTNVSDLSPLKDCKSLQSLNAKRTKVTAENVAALQEALPNCKIEWDRASDETALSDPTFNGHRYRFVGNVLTWDQAKAKAESLGGHLATITTQEEDIWLRQTFSEKIPVNFSGFWLGASQANPDAAWQWVTGEPFIYTNWGLNEPNCRNKSNENVPPYYLNYFHCKSWPANFGWNDSALGPVGFWSGQIKGYLVEWDAVSPPQVSSTADPKPLVAPFDAKQARAGQEAWAKHLGTAVEQKNSIGMTMVLIPPGEFMMGSTDEQVDAALKVAEEIKATLFTKDNIKKTERPRHRVLITKPFLLGGTEVTIGQFRQFVEAAKYLTEAEQYAVGNSTDKAIENAKNDQKGKNWRSPGYSVVDDMPVTQVTWNDACAFCNWLSDQERLSPYYRKIGDSWFVDKTTGTPREPNTLGFHLPTEAEWEYACRAGTTTHYSFGDDYKELEEFGWFSQNSGGRARGVGLKSPNPFGLHDMHGNASEWCQDSYDETWYRKSLIKDPNGPSTGSSRVIRGGGWDYGASFCRSAFRFSPSSSFNYYGFRVARVW